MGNQMSEIKECGGGAGGRKSIMEESGDSFNVNVFGSRWSSSHQHQAPADVFGGRPFDMAHSASSSSKPTSSNYNAPDDHSSFLTHPKALCGGTRLKIRTLTAVKNHTSGGKA